MHRIFRPGPKVPFISAVRNLFATDCDALHHWLSEITVGMIATVAARSFIRLLTTVPLSRMAISCALKTLSLALARSLRVDVVTISPVRTS